MIIMSRLVLPNELILKIYKKVDDYQTLCNFYVLNRKTYDLFMYYKKATFKHKFYILFHHIFSFLEMLPLSTLTDSDMDFLVNIEGNCLESKIFKREMWLVYNLYKTLITSEFRKCLGYNYPNENRIILNILSRGPRHIYRFIKVTISKNMIVQLTLINVFCLALDTFEQHQLENFIFFENYLNH
jgi:hypothetical protein